jgi:hypothetical protein
VRQLIETGVMSMDFVRSERNLTDPLTKPLARRLVSEPVISCVVEEDEWEKKRKWERKRRRGIFIFYFILVLK